MSDLNGWNDASEEVIKSIGESCQGYKLMHFYSARYYSFLYTVLMYANLIISPVAGVIASIDAIINPPSMPYSITIACLSYISAVLTAFVKFGKFNEKYECHKVTTSKYSSIETNIRTQLGLYKTDRVPGKEYLAWITKSSDDLYQGSPFIRSFIYNKYYKISNQYNLTFPDRYNKFIIVHKGETDKFIDSMHNDNVIRINTEESPRGEKDLEKGEETQKTVTFSDSESVKTKVDVAPRRNSLYSPIADFNRYNDSQMKYEMKRFMGL